MVAPLRSLARAEPAVVVMAGGGGGTYEQQNRNSTQQFGTSLLRVEYHGTQTSIWRFHLQAVHANDAYKTEGLAAFDHKWRWRYGGLSLGLGIMALRRDPVVDKGAGTDSFPFVLVPLAAVELGPKIFYVYAAMNDGLSMHTGGHADPGNFDISGGVGTIWGRIELRYNSAIGVRELAVEGLADVPIWRCLGIVVHAWLGGWSDDSPFAGGVAALGVKLDGASGCRAWGTATAGSH
jgi:hypothetical protein